MVIATADGAPAAGEPPGADGPAPGAGQPLTMTLERRGGGPGLHVGGTRGSGVGGVARPYFLRQVSRSASGLRKFQNSS